MPIPGRRTFIMLGAAVVLVSSACCVVSRSADTHVTGDAVLKGGLDAPQDGVTTRDDLVHAFGAPKQTMKLEGGREVLVYVYERRDRSNLNVLLLLNWGNSTTRLVRYCFEFKDGLLVRRWKEDVR